MVKIVIYEYIIIMGHEINTNVITKNVNRTLLEMILL